MRVKVSNVAFSKNEFLTQKLLALFPDAVINYGGKRYKDAELKDYFSDADAAIVGLELITADLLDAVPNLRCVAKYGVGLDNIDLDACRQRNIYVGWSPGVNREAVAELALGFMLSLFRNIYVTSNQLKQSVWNKSGGVQLKGKTVGIIGLGHIGKSLVKLLQPFECRIIANDIENQDAFANEFGILMTEKDVIFRDSDVISIHTPFTSETNNLFNAEVFKQMKKTAFIINTARGGIVNESDLSEALMNGVIAGAALDVYSVEPPANERLLKLENLICTPHIGGNSYEAVVQMGLSAIDHLLKYKSEHYI